MPLAAADGLQDCGGVAVLATCLRIRPHWAAGQQYRHTASLLTVTLRSLRGRIIRQ